MQSTYHLAMNPRIKKKMHGCRNSLVIVKYHYEIIEHLLLIYIYWFQCLREYVFLAEMDPWTTYLFVQSNAELYYCVDRINRPMNWNIKFMNMIVTYTDVSQRNRSIMRICWFVDVIVLVVNCIFQYFRSPPTKDRYVNPLPAQTNHLRQLPMSESAKIYGIRSYFVIREAKEGCLQLLAKEEKRKNKNIHNLTRNETSIPNILQYGRLFCSGNKKKDIISIIFVLLLLLFDGRWFLCSELWWLFLIHCCAKSGFGQATNIMVIHKISMNFHTCSLIPSSIVKSK